LKTGCILYFAPISLESALAGDITSVMIFGHGRVAAITKEVPDQMDSENAMLAGLIKEIRRQLSLSQEDLARQLNVSYATVNRWENSQAKPSKLARSQLQAFCARMIERGRLAVSPEQLDSAGLRQDEE